MQRLTSLKDDTWPRLSGEKGIGCPVMRNVGHLFLCRSCDSSMRALRTSTVATYMNSTHTLHLDRFWSERQSVFRCYRLGRIGLPKSDSPPQHPTLHRRDWRNALKSPDLHIRSTLKRSVTPEATAQAVSRIAIRLAGGQPSNLFLRHSGDPSYVSHSRPNSRVLRRIGKIRLAMLGADGD